MRYLCFIFCVFLVGACSSRSNKNTLFCEQNKEVQDTLLSVSQKVLEEDDVASGKEKNADSLFLSRIIDGDFFEQEHSEEQDYILAIRHCLFHTDESYDETFSEGLCRMLRKYPKKIEGLRKALERLPPKQRERANYEMMVLIVSAWMMEQDTDSIDPKSFYHIYPFFEKCSMIDKILMEQKL